MSKFAAFAAGLGSGYLKGQQQNLENERQDKLDAMREKQFGWAEQEAADKQRERENKAAIDKAIVDVNSSGQIKNDVGAVTYTTDSGEQKTAMQPDVQTAQFAAEQDALERGTAMPDSDAPTAPKVESASSVRSLSGGQKLFTGLDSAAQASKFAAENPTTSYSKYMALSEKLAALPGGQERADQYFARAKTLQKEGVNTALAMLDAGDPEGAMKAFNSVGSVKLPEGSKFVAREGVDPLTRAKKTIYSAVDPSGKTIVKDVHQAAYNHLLDFKDRATIEASLSKADDSAEARRYAADQALMKGLLLGRGAGGAGGSGTGSGGKAEKDPFTAASKEVGDLVESIATKGEAKLPAGQIGDAQQYAQQVLFEAPRDSMGRPKIPTALAANVGVKIAMNPEKVVPRLNPDTGLIDRTFADDSTGETFTLRAGVGSAQKPGVPKEFDLGKATVGMLDHLEGLSPGAKDAYIKAAFDKSGANGTSLARRDLEQKELAELRARMESEIPGFKDAPKERQDAAFNAASKTLLGAIGNRLNMVSMYGQAPKKTGANTLNVGGLNGGSAYVPPPDSPAGQMQARQAEIKAANDKAAQRRLAEQQALSKQYQADKAAMPALDLARKYDAVRGSLPRADAMDLQTIEKTIR